MERWISFTRQPREEDEEDDESDGESKVKEGVMRKESKIIAIDAHEPYQEKVALNIS